MTKKNYLETFEKCPGPLCYTNFFFVISYVTKAHFKKKKQYYLFFNYKRLKKEYIYIYRK